MLPIALSWIAKTLPQREFLWAFFYLKRLHQSLRKIILQRLGLVFPFWCTQKKQQREFLAMFHFPVGFRGGISVFHTNTYHCHLLYQDMKILSMWWNQMSIDSETLSVLRSKELYFPHDVSKIGFFQVKATIFLAKYWANVKSK